VPYNPDIREKITQGKALALYEKEVASLQPAFYTSPLK